jgi:hypothetical protein
MARLYIQIWHSWLPGARSHGLAFGGVGRPQAANALSAATIRAIRSILTSER